MIDYQTFYYLYFVLFSVALLYAGQKITSKKNVIFVINILFHVLYFYFNKKQFASFQLILLTGYFAAKWLSEKEERKNLSAFLVSFTALVFIELKYSALQFTVLRGIAPTIAFIGLSFVTFRLISLFVDLKRKAIKREITFIDYYNYITFFPSYLSGPLDKYGHFVSETEKENEPDIKELLENIYRIVLGTFKKIVIADFLANLSIDSMYTPDVLLLPFYKVMISMYIYSMVLYFDFSGYSDVAVGVGGLFGIKVPENFNSPFSSKNIQEFWNRWHISFMHWLRDYVYYPLQMFLLKTVKIKNTVLVASLGFFVTFLIAGLWHGSSKHYFYYGLYHGICYSIYLIWRHFLLKKGTLAFKTFYNKSNGIKILSVVITYHYFILGLFFFTDKYHYFLNLLGIK
ncbi:MAG: hypothetical protein H7336_17485 [Bacteriovorax sp.]|nr:hypothetical protein [Bacteriovorax sp.]